MDTYPNNTNMKNNFNNSENKIKKLNNLDKSIMNIYMYIHTSFYLYFVFQSTCRELICYFVCDKLGITAKMSQIYVVPSINERKQVCA